MKKTILISLVLFFLLQTAFPQTNADSLQVSLSQVDVIAQRVKLYSSQARILQVMDKLEIEKLPVNNIDELLETVSGIDIRNRGVGGTQADISIRGGSFDQVLILLNGINITDPHTGHYNIDIPVELSDIQRIEILQGSAARIYGTGAFSGAINIITEKNEDSALSAQVGGGSYNTFLQHVSANVNTKTIKTFASVSHKSSDGHIANTDYDILNAFSQTVFTPKNMGKFDLQLAYQQKNYGANGFYSLRYDNQFDHTKTFFAALNWSLNKGNWSTTAQTYWKQHHDRFELIRGDQSLVPFNYHLVDVAGVNANTSYFSDYGKFTLGFDIRNEHIFSSKLGKAMDKSLPVPFEKGAKFHFEDNRFLPTVFVDYALNVGSFFVSVGVSTIFSEQYGNNVLGGADVSYKVNENLKAFVSANTAMHLPTFTDLYYTTTITHIGNPDLKPERSRTLEAGVALNNNSLKVNASVFHRWGSNIIDWIKMPLDSVWQSRNHTDINTIGVDLLAEYNFDNKFLKQISLACLFLNSDKSTNDYDSQYALDYLKFKSVLGLQHSIFSNLSAQWGVGFYDREGSYTINNELKNYDPYFTANLRVQWQKPKYSVYVDLNNFTNTQYIDYAGLTQPGITCMVGVKIKTGF